MNRLSPARSIYEATSPIAPPRVTSHHLPASSPGYGLENRVSVPGKGASSPAVQQTQRPVQWLPAALSSAAKPLGHQADHLPQFRTAIKNAWSFTSMYLGIITAWG